MLCRRRSKGGLGRLADVQFVTEATGKHRRRDRFEMRLASHRAVQRFEAPGSIEQQGRSVAAARAGERDLRAQPLQPGALKLVEWSEVGGRQQFERGVRCAGVELSLRGRQSPPTSLRRIRGQLCRLGQERRSRRRASPGLRPAGRALQLGRHRLVDTHRRLSKMPRQTIGIGIRVDCLRQRPMHGPARGRRGCPVDRGAHQWMPEAGTGSDFHQLRVFCRGERALFDAKRVGGPPDQRRVTRRLGRGEQQESLSRLRKLAHTTEIVILEMARKVCGREDPEAARELGCTQAQAPRQIEQSERVAAGFRDDAIADMVVEPTRDGSYEQGARILLG